MFGRHGPLKQHEKVVLDAVVAAAPPELRQVLEAQVRQIRWVQRLANSPEVNFYAKKRAARGWDSGELFPNRSEVRIATAVLTVDSERHECTLDAVLGHLFSLTIRPPVRLKSRSQCSVSEVEVVKPRRVLDPSGAGSAADLSPTSFSESASAGSQTPPRGWLILGPRDTYVVSLEERDAVALAAGPDGRLLLGWEQEGREGFGLVDPDAQRVVTLEAASFGSALVELARVLPD